jgi:hypothetical protein
LEEFTGTLGSKLVAVWQNPDSAAASVWLPTEFMLSQYITRILVTGRNAPASVVLTADSNWTQVWRSPGAKEWSCLLGILAHMPGPVLIVVGPDITLTPKLVTALRAVVAATTAIVLRSSGFPGWVGEPAEQVFFPVLGVSGGGLLAAAQEWVPRSMPRSLELRPLIPQLAAAGYGLTVAEGVWHWYKPVDSPPLSTLTVAQIARQLQILGSALEKTAIL